MKYSGSCHCGAINFNFEQAKIASGLRCNCSICRRKGAIMSAFTLAPDEIKIVSKGGALTTYEFGACVAKHHFCNECGIYTFHQTMIKPGHYRVNLGCVDDVDTAGLPIDVFDGASL
jgi:hypothetical protein